MHIDPKLIIEFGAIAEAGSFTRAAAKLRVAQPWLSARLSKLETILGFKLIERTTRSFALTQRGAEFLKAVRQFVQAYEDVERVALQLQRSDRRILRIGAAPYTRISGQRRALLNGFTSTHPDVGVELVTGWSHALMGLLDAGEIDLAFIMGDHWPGQFEGLVLCHHGVALTLTRDNPLADAIRLPPQAILGKPVRVFTRSLYPEIWDVLYAPLLEVGAKLVEAPDMAEGPPGWMSSREDVAAFFDFGRDDPGTEDVVRIPLSSAVAVPFILYRRAGTLSRDAEDLWRLAASHSLHHDAVQS